MPKGIVAGLATVGLVAIAVAFAGATSADPQDRDAIEIAEGVHLYNIAAAEGAEAQDCSIKGNVSRSGERIYHVSGGRFYDRTKIDEGAGERFFCSEDEAAAAGWRRSKQ
jgi:hypothetical protein